MLIFSKIIVVLTRCLLKFHKNNKFSTFSVPNEDNNQTDILLKLA